MIKILNVTKLPLTTIGQVAICYNTTNEKRYQAIAKNCLESHHDRIAEFASITIEIEGYSAKMGRELYTHVCGTSRLQASTRYIDYSKQFNYITPPSIENNRQAMTIWLDVMENINLGMKRLKELNVPSEDLTNLLPLAYDTKIVLQINLRALIHMFNLRSCNCAYYEFRLFMTNLKNVLKGIDEEWEFLCDNYFHPKCIANGYCDEKNRTCGLMPLKESDK